MKNKVGNGGGVEKGTRKCDVINYFSQEQHCPHRIFCVVGSSMSVISNMVACAVLWGY